MDTIRTIKTRAGWRLEVIDGTDIECRTYSRAELARHGIERDADPNADYWDNAAYTNAEYLWDDATPSKTETKLLAHCPQCCKDVGPEHFACVTAAAAGAAGTGDAKSRGDSEHYRKVANARWEKQRNADSAVEGLSSKGAVR